MSDSYSYQKSGISGDCEIKRILFYSLSSKKSIVSPQAIDEVRIDNDGL